MQGGSHSSFHEVLLGYLHLWGIISDYLDSSVLCHS
jgi:hypothetical protein